MFEVCHAHLGSVPPRGRREREAAYFVVGGRKELIVLKGWKYKVVGVGEDTSTNP